MNEEEFREVAGSDGKYMISNQGRILKVEVPFLPAANSVGYRYITVRQKKTESVHRLVAETFIGEISDGYVVNHKNLDKSDNRVENLEIISRSENLKHWLQHTGGNPIWKLGRKPVKLCHRGHDKEGRRLCNQCQREKYAGKVYKKPNDREWKPFHKYHVSDRGDIWSNTMSIMVKLGRKRGNYVRWVATINGKNKHVSIHRLVAQLFIGKIPKGHVVHHINGDKVDNRVENLMICTPSHNIKEYHTAKKQNDKENTDEHS